MKMAVTVISHEDYRAQTTVLRVAEEGSVSVTRRVQQTICLLTSYNLHGPISLSLYGPYAQRVDQSSLDIFADTDCYSLVG